MAEQRVLLTAENGAQAWVEMSAAQAFLNANKGKPIPKKITTAQSEKLAKRSLDSLIKAASLAQRN